MTKALEIRPLLPEHRDLIITRDQINLLLLEAHKKSSNAAEEVMALREIAKINGMYVVAPVNQTINLINLEQNQKKLEEMSDEALLELAGKHPNLFKRPDPIADAEHIEAEFEEIEEQEKEDDAEG